MVPPLRLERLFDELVFGEHRFEETGVRMVELVFGERVFETTGVRGLSF